MPTRARSHRLFAVTACVAVVAACHSTPDRGAVVEPPPLAASPVVAAAPEAGASAPAGTQALPPKPPPPPRDVPPAECAQPIRHLKHALAIPQGKTGTIEIVLTDHPTRCRYWTDPMYRNRCDVWRARIHVNPSMQQVGRYPLEPSATRFAYLDRKVTSPGGAWLDAGVCKDIGGDIHGELEVLGITQDAIQGRICGSRAGTDARSGGVLDGTFTAKRCPACGMPGDACQSNDECCTNLCGGGRCGP